MSSGMGQRLICGLVVSALAAPALADGEAPSATTTTPTTTPASPHGEQNVRVVTTYRWPRWLPWTVFGTGIALGTLGIMTEFVAAHDMDAYEQRYAASCANGCNLENPQDPNEEELARQLNGQRETAEYRRKVGFVFLIAATATIVTGIVLLAKNRPEHHVHVVDLVPTEGGATATVGWRF